MGNIKNKMKKYMPWLMLVCAYVAYLIYYNKFIGFNIDSDMSSELVLGKLLAKEHKLITTSWYYSTELRVINTNIIYMLSFLFTDNYHVVRVVSAAIWPVLLFLSFYYLCQQIGIKKWFPYLATLFLCPMSKVYFQIIMMGHYYYPHIIFILLGVALYFNIAKEESTKKRRILLALSGILAFVSGLGGMRMLVILYMPMLGIEIIEFVNKRKPRVDVVINFCIAGFGYFLNLFVISKYIRYARFGDTRPVKPEFINLIRPIQGLINCFGYEAISLNGIIICKDILILLVTLLIGYILLKNKKEEKEEYILLFSIISLLLLCLIYGFTNMVYTDRYLIPLKTLLYVVFGIVLNKCMNNKIMLAIFGIFMCACMVISIKGIYSDFGTVDKSGRYRDVAEYAVQNQIRYGYATYWNANIISEFNNEYTDMYAWNDDASTWLYDVDMLYEFLQKTEHINNRPDGKVMVVVKEKELDDGSILTALKKREYDFASKELRVYVFDSYHEMKDFFSH